MDEKDFGEPVMLKFLKELREKRSVLVDSLISGTDRDDFIRGQIAQIDDILLMSKSPPEIIESPEYN